MSVRIKKHWYQDGRERSPEEKATVAAVAIWKCARHGLQGLRKARFDIDVGAPFISVLGEFLAFLVTTADRIAYLHVVSADDGEASDRQDAAEWRSRFTIAMARRVAGLYQENLEELIGTGETPNAHADRLIALINQRMADFAEFEYGLAGPDFGFLRLFGTFIEAALPDDGNRRWVLDQVMATQAPEAIETVDGAMRAVLGLDPKPQRRRDGQAG